ncbi:glycosyltransferase [Candidatus Saccharibacteria bacterium]|nr:glycosyltransferase [Candidatus Saccharibacteria bacterium]
MNLLELRSRAHRTFIFTVVSSLLLIGYVWFFDVNFAVSKNFILISQFLVAVALSLSVAITFILYRPKKIISSITESKLPTVSVCIPARNETQDLPECIESVLQSSYPKLEIIVLDDCSHDNTPDIIKRYAHAGVRFVNGKEPRDDWLAKNAAYDRLADEANGEILIFMGVDVRLAKDTITNIITHMNDVDMISILPRRDESAEASIFIQPIRFWWELGLWRFAFSKPPIMSTCWAIRKSTLDKQGTFESIKKAVDPEAVLAQKLHHMKSYSFYISNANLEIKSAKMPKDQYQTSLRKRYPQLRRRPENVLILIAFELLFIIAPYIWFVYLSLSGINGYIYQTSLATVVLLSIANSLVYRLTLKRLWPLGLLSMPSLALADCLLAIKSMYSYEFGKVIWKERNICLPLFKVEKSLPKI